MRIVFSVALLVAWWPGGLVHIATQYMNESDAFVTILVDVLWIAATVTDLRLPLSIGCDALLVLAILPAGKILHNGLIRSFVLSGVAFMVKSYSYAYTP